jgi:transcription elongation GreA/GreB family factor/very-short-patch-repair endonuclease
MTLSTEQQRLVSMLDYLEEWDKLNRVPVFDVAAHQGGFVAWQHDLTGLPGIHFDLADDSSEIWMEIERLRPAKPPQPPAALVPWMLLRDNPSAEPDHRETLPNPEIPEKPLVFEENPSLVSAFQTYVNGPWKKWAEAERPRRTSIGIYDKLFNLLQTVETEGAETALELVWGIGVAVWNKDGNRVRYPLVSKLVEIDPISRDMALRVRPREVPPVLETDIYATLDDPGLPVFERAARAILENPDVDVTPFDEASYEQLLSGAAGTLDRQARYWPREPDFQPGMVPPATDALTVTNAWVIFARRKGTNFLIEDIRRLRAEVVKGPVPEGAPKILVEDPVGAVAERQPRTWRGVSSTEFAASWSEPAADNIGNTGHPPGDLYFPKPFNAEQIQIIERFEHASGIVVQGPPGTGKSHTIANVICHYLAEGKRVLVTSKGESALTVLREHLPASVQSMTVSLLTSEREGLKQLEQSVHKITTEISSLNKAEVRREIERCRGTIDRLHHGIGAIDRELAKWAHKNINPAPPALDGLRPEALAQHVLETQKAYSWFPDRLDGQTEHEITLAPDAVDQLREARLQVGKGLVYLRSKLPGIVDLPTVNQIGDVHRSLLELVEVTGVIDEKRVPRFRTISVSHLEAASNLRALLFEAIRIRRSLSEGWNQWLRQQYEAGGGAASVFSAMTQIAGELGMLLETRRQHFGVAIQWEDEWDSDEELLAAIKNSAAGRRAFGLNPFGKKTARERYQRVQLNGKNPTKQQDWAWIESHVILRQQTRTVVCRWNTLCTECPAPSLPEQPMEALRASEVLQGQMREAQRWVKELAPEVATQLHVIFADLSTAGVPDDPARMEALAEAIGIRLCRHRLQSAKEEHRRIRELFKGEPLELFNQAIGFIDHFLGKPQYDVETVEKAWQSILDQIERLQGLQPYFATIQQVTDAIRAAGAPQWAKRLESEPALADCFDWTPLDWSAAWKWSRQFGYLLEIDGRARVQSLAAQRKNLERDLSAAYTRLVEQLTWLKLRETLDQDRGLMSALQQYVAAIRSIGKGTGVRAERYRRDARRAMTRANRAIRCWIMPHWRVSESLPSELALFDLVIVDEASQSDLWALPALLRAKKVLIVGDNKQVSPAAIGVKEVDVRQLYARFLRTLPFGDVLSPEKSIYDLASVMFAGDLVRLREHFRCVEPIIEFSNRLCYHGEIKCLRLASASERITPPLVDVFVKDGRRDSHSAKINRPEAQAIADEIKVLTLDPAFAKRTIGVVSLLGSEQSHHIFQLLVAQIGEEKIVQHKIRCGDAMTFQGREADIVFISMVADTQSLTALTSEMFEQRFNVALSRARDRLYLYRSFRREDLKDHDLRARLLDHFAAPLRRGPEKKGRERCESDFERAVFDRLAAAGYRVTPQVPAAGYRIDLVVEGHSGRRLAIECDGDQYHPPEMWLQDLNRQRILERVGWTFWRCWGSSFLRDPDACMQDLFGVLNTLGIEPIGALDIDFTDIVEYREVGKTSSDQDLDTALVQTDLDIVSVVPDPEVAATEKRATEPTSQPSAPSVTVGDSVRYCFVDSPDEDAVVIIVESKSNPELGFINKDTPVARALLGAAVGQEREVALPMGKRTIRVLEIFSRSENS